MNRSLCVAATALVVAGSGTWGAASFVFAAGQVQPAGPSQPCAVTDGQTQTFIAADGSKVIEFADGQTGTIVNADGSSEVVTCISTSPDAPRPPPNPRSPHRWDVYVDAFEATVEIENISYSDGSCSMAGGTVNAKFKESPDTHGKVAGSIQRDPQVTTSISFEFYVDSDATVAAQSGQSSPGAPLRCAAMSHHFKNNTYRFTGDVPAHNGPTVMTSSMPQDDDTAGNIGCEPESHSCHVEFWFDNSPGTAQTLLDLPKLLATGSVVMPIQGKAHNLASYGETRSGDFKWSGSVTLRAVAR
jgi:hypothetical protein